MATLHSTKGQGIQLFTPVNTLSHPVIRVAPRF